MWYIEASEYPLLNRKMMDKQIANTSENGRPKMLLFECNMVKEKNNCKLFEPNSYFY